LAFQVQHFQYLGHPFAEEAIDGTVIDGSLYILVNRLNPDTGYDPVVVKTDLDGNFQSEHNIGGNDWEFANRMREIGDNLFIVGSWPGSSSDDRGIFLCKLDSELNEIFRTIAYPEGDCTANDIFLWNDSLYVCGSVLGANIETNERFPSVFLFNSEGELEETISFDSEFGEAFFIGEVPTGLMLAGTNYIANPNGSFCAWRISPDLSLIWKDTYGGIQGAIKDANIESDRIMFLGTTPTFSLNNDEDVFFLLGNISGDFQGSRIYGGGGSDSARRIFRDSEDRQIALGETSSFTGPDNQAYAVLIPMFDFGTSGNNEGQVFDLHDNTINTYEIEFVNVKVFPNPSVSGLFNLTRNDLIWEVRDCLGSVVTRSGSFHNRQIDLQNQSNGLYLLNIKTVENNWLTVRLVRQ
jgi:hypothetical protein